MNIKEELLRQLVNKAEIKCALIRKGADYYEPEEQKTVILKKGYTSEDYINFLNKLDFNYNNGYGGQELYGNVWLKDGTWLERGEYDGSEWWEHKVLPEIPKILK